jgi:TetR/AcrR family transcriptional regulator, fatty acid metabolism regulator protein
MMKKNLGSTISEKQARKRLSLLEAAIKVFSEKGFHGSKISEIAQEAGVADGTCYLYFKNKDDLLITAVEHLFEKKLKEVESRIAFEKTGLQKLLSFAEEHISTFTEEPKIVRFLAVELRQSKEFYKKYPNFMPLRHYLDMFQDICEQAIEEGSIRKIDAEALSFIVFGTVNFVITEWAVREQVFSLEQMKNLIIDIISYGLVKRE